MSLTNLMTRDVTVVRPASTTNRYHNAVADWDNATETATKGWIAQSSSSEPTSAGRDPEVTFWHLYLPVGTDIVAADRVVVDDVTYEVVGPPNRAHTPLAEHHVEATVRLVAG